MESLRNNQVYPKPLENEQLDSSNMQEHQSQNTMYQPEENQNYQSIDIGSNQNLSQLLKDQSFTIQKQLGVRALLIYFCGHFFSDILIYKQFVFDRSTLDINVSMILSYTYLGGIIITRFQSFQKVTMSIIIFVLLPILQAQVLYIYFESQHSSLIKDSNLIEKNFFIKICAAILMIVLFLETVTLIIYISCQKEELKLKNFYIMYGCISLLPSLLISPGLLSTSIGMFYRAFTLSITIQQQFKGRFSLKINSIFGIANSIYFGMFLPCNF